MFKIIDVSKWNGTIDFTKVKATGVKGVIIRAGYGKTIEQKDKTFERYYADAKAAGLHIGSYWYSYANDVATATIEANVFLAAIKNKKFDLPVYLDMEEASQVKLPKSLCTQMAVAFCGTLENAGYYAGVYSFDSFFNSSWELSIQSRYTCWPARVENVRPQFCRKYDMWQFSWKGEVDGITGDVDLNQCFRDFPTIIQNAGLNGYGKKTYSIVAVKDGLSESQLQVEKKKLYEMGYVASVKTE